MTGRSWPILRVGGRLLCVGDSQRPKVGPHLRTLYGQRRPKPALRGTLKRGPAPRPNLSLSPRSAADSAIAAPGRANATPAARLHIAISPAAFISRSRFARRTARCLIARTSLPARVPAPRHCPGAGGHSTGLCLAAVNARRSSLTRGDSELGSTRSSAQVDRRFYRPAGFFSIPQGVGRA